MILRKYGQNLQSVEPNFDPRAMNEIGFLKTDAMTLTTADFAEQYERVGGHELVAQAAGDVQHDAEAQVLASLKEQLLSIEGGLEEGQVLLVESEMGKDYPKLRETVTTTVVGLENRLHFDRSVDPPLRIGVYKPRTR